MNFNIEYNQKEFVQFVKSQSGDGYDHHVFEVDENIVVECGIAWNPTEEAWSVWAMLYVYGEIINATEAKPDMEGVRPVDFFINFTKEKLVPILFEHVMEGLANRINIHIYTAERLSEFAETLDLTKYIKRATLDEITYEENKTND